MEQLSQHPYNSMEQLSQHPNNSMEQLSQHPNGQAKAVIKQRWLLQRGSPSSGLHEHENMKGKVSKNDVTKFEEKWSLIREIFCQGTHSGRLQNICLTM